MYTDYGMCDICVFIGGRTRQPVQQLYVSNTQRGGMLTTTVTNEGAINVNISQIVYFFRLPTVSPKVYRPTYVVPQTMVPSSPPKCTDPHMWYLKQWFHPLPQSVQTHICGTSNNGSTLSPKVYRPTYVVPQTRVPSSSQSVQTHICGTLNNGSIHTGIVY